MCVCVGVVYVDIVCNWPRVASYALVRDFKSASKTALSLRTYYIDVLSRLYVCVCVCVVKCHALLFQVAHEESLSFSAHFLLSRGVNGYAFSKS